MFFDALTRQFAELDFHPFADGAVLHRVGTRRLQVLNRSAAVLWCLLPEAADRAQLVRRYAEHFRLPGPQAAADVAATLARLAESLAPEVEPQEGTADFYPLDGPETAVPEGPAPAFKVGRWLGRIFCSDLALARELARIFPPGELSDPGFFLSVLPGKDGFAIAREGRLVVSGLAREQVLSHLVTLVFFAVCAAHPEAFLLHAATLQKGDRSLLLVGGSGSGKSTLAAALAAEGWCCHGDELAALNPLSGTVTGLPLPLVLKEGALAPLRSRYPDLATLPVHHRADGQRARYLPVADSPEPLAAIPRLVFPCFEPGAPTSLLPVTPSDVLQQLADAGSSERPLEEKDVAALVRLAEEARGARLIFSNIDEAVGAIGAESWGLA